MFFAEHPTTGETTPAVRGETATCPACRGDVFGRAGITELVRVHWAHRDGNDCDPWAEKFKSRKAADWHKNWQDLADRARREVSMPPHRADIVALDGQVIEIQHSGINKLQIEDREKFYGNMVWIWDTIDPYEKQNLTVHPSKNWELPANFRTFTWVSPRKSLWFSIKRSIFDLGNDQLLFVGNIGGTLGTFDGWGYLYDKATVIEWINEGPPPQSVDPRKAWEAKREAERQKLLAEKRQREQEQRQREAETREAERLRRESDARERHEAAEQADKYRRMVARQKEEALAKQDAESRLQEQAAALRVERERRAMSEIEQHRAAFNTVMELMPGSELLSHEDEPNPDWEQPAVHMPSLKTIPNRPTGCPICGDTQTSPALTQRCRHWHGDSTPKNN